MKKRIWNLLIILVISCQIYAQEMKSYLEKGDRFFSKKEYENALMQYELGYGIDPADAVINFRIGITHLYLPTKSRALRYIQKAYETNPNVDADINYHLGLAYQYSNMFLKAIEQFELFKKKNKKLSDIADHKIYECQVGDSLYNMPVKVLIENMGNVVNTKYHDYSPIISANGSTLIFTSNRISNDPSQQESSENFEDIYFSRRVANAWSTPQLISPNINIKFHDAAASLSADGKTLFLYYEQGGGDIYTSTFDGLSWSKPVPLNKNINTPFWETSACISSDGQQLFFTSSRPGGFGQLDIYVSYRDSKGDWGKAINLGKTVNTPGNEDSPFIHADGTSLYFSSDGHPTMGSNDIFLTEFKYGTWQKPRNLGYPINSVEYDGFFSLSTDKKTGYYSTMREDGYGDTDIYSVTFLETPKPADFNLMASTKKKIIEESAESSTSTVEEEFVDPIIQLHKDLKIVTTLKGKVIDATSAAPLGATITLVDNEKNVIVTKIKSNPKTGDFELIIPHGGNYGVATEMGGYLFNSINFNLPQFAEYQEIDTHILMVKAEVGSKAVLKNIFFDTGKSEVKLESISELSNVLELLESNPHVKVQINGHTDNTGDADTNKALSLKRATAVVDYLITKGISTERLTAVGYGEERPLVSNDDERDGREINRRTEIEIIELIPQG